MNDFGAKIWQLIIGLVKHAAEALPGVTGKEKKAKVVEWVAEMVNLGESLLPVAKWANIKEVDLFEEFIIGLGVEWAWTQLQLPTDTQLAVVKLAPVVLPRAA